jgi:hypothetical protein
MALPNGGSAYQVSDGNVDAAKSVGGSILSFASGAGIYFLTTAITANTTTTTAPSGSFGMTTNATGLGKLFYSDGSKWQFAAVS